MKITILGCGASSGVPQIGAGWGDCDPANLKNRRRRSSILVQNQTTDLLVDCSPDCRQQLLDVGISRLDGVLFTHAHADHCHGIDDLRWINMAMDSDLQVYGRAEHLETIQQKFSYVFEPLKAGINRFYYKPVLVRNDITEHVLVGDIEVYAFEQSHGYSTTLGFRFGDIAYSTDVVRLNEAGFAALEGVKIWIVDCFRREPHQTHSWLEQTLSWIERIQPERAILTHMGQTLDYETLLAETPDNVEPAYDGMVLEINQA